jgi:hypothetical protein
VLPADEGFNADDPAAFQVELRLIVQQELVAADGTPQVLLEQQHR